LRLLHRDKGRGVIKNITGLPFNIWIGQPSKREHCISAWCGASFVQKNCLDIFIIDFFLRLLYDIGLLAIKQTPVVGGDGVGSIS